MPALRVVALLSHSGRGNCRRKSRSPDIVRIAMGEFEGEQVLFVLLSRWLIWYSRELGSLKLCTWRSSVTIQELG